jgi:hypothetical protein
LPVSCYRLRSLRRMARAQLSRSAPPSNTGLPTFVRDHPQNSRRLTITTAISRPIPLQTLPSGGDFGSLSFKFSLPCGGPSGLREKGIDEVEPEVFRQRVLKTVTDRTIIEQSAKVALVRAQAKRQLSNREPRTRLHVFFDVPRHPLTTSGNGVVFDRDPQSSRPHVCTRELEADLEAARSWKD